MLPHWGGLDAGVGRVRVSTKGSGKRVEVGEVVGIPGDKPGGGPAIKLLLGAIFGMVASPVLGQVEPRGSRRG